MGPTNKTVLPALKLLAHLRLRTINKYNVTDFPILSAASYTTKKELPLHD